MSAEIIRFNRAAFRHQRAAKVLATKLGVDYAASLIAYLADGTQTNLGRWHVLMREGFQPEQARAVLGDLGHFETSARECARCNRALSPKQQCGMDKSSGLLFCAGCAPKRGESAK